MWDEVNFFSLMFWDVAVGKPRRKSAARIVQVQSCF